MVLTSYKFIAFVAIVFAVVFLPGLVTRGKFKSARWQNLVLLLASFGFYATNGLRATALVIASILINYVLVFVLSHQERYKSQLTVLAVCINVGVLALFKFAVLLPKDSLIIPIGLSFYTFQSIAYILDVAQGRSQPVQSIIDYALFISFFPLTISGPIERAKHLIPQLQQYREMKWQSIEKGVPLIVKGLFKKIVLAKIAGDWVDIIWANPHSYSSLEILAAIYLFAFVIYTDFAGYTDIVRGIAYLFGIELLENFRAPYLAVNFTDFWQRWHISLSSWFRDYVFFPMSCRLMRITEARNKELVRVSSLMTTMLLTGLWHGVGWNYLIWGGLHGVFMSFDRGTHQPTSRLRHIIRVVITFHLITFTWLFFRGTLSEVWTMLKQLALGTVSIANANFLPSVIVVIVVSFGLDFIEQRPKGTAIPWWAQVVGMGTAAFLVVMFWGAANGHFIYANF